jgi:hypothetical protein
MTCGESAESGTDAGPPRRRHGTGFPYNQPGMTMHVTTLTTQRDRRTFGRTGRTARQGTPGRGNGNAYDTQFPR